jgi:hypothetical protein
LLKHHIQRKDAEQDVSKTIEKGFADIGIALHYKKKYLGIKVNEEELRKLYKWIFESFKQWFGIR